MKKTKEEAAGTRQTIMAAALKVFSQKGYTDTRLEEIAEAAGVTRGAIYWHFKNKFELMFSLLKECKTRVMARMDRVLESDRTPLEKIRLWINEFISAMGEEEELQAIGEIMLFKSLETDQLKAMADERSCHMRLTRKILRSLLEQAVDSGEIYPGIDLDVTSLALSSYIMGIAAAWLHDHSAFSPRENADQFFRIFFYSLVREPLPMPEEIAPKE